MISAFVLTAAIAAATPAVDTDAVYRHGNSVESTDTYQAPVQSSGASALAPPKDDSHKWFVSVLTMQGCAPCQRLKADFVSSPHLRAFANPLDKETSWAHYNVYAREDATQSHRWRNLKIDSYPTIIIQPPMNGSFGKPSTVVFQQSGYDGDAAKLGQAMSKAITTYVARYQQHRGEKAGDLVPVGFTDVSQCRPGQPFPCPPPVNPLPDGYNPHQPQPYGPTPSPLVVVPPRTPATLDQLRAAIPGATAEFLLEAVARQLTIEEAVAAWQQMAPAVPLPVPNLPKIPGWMIGAAVAAAIAYYLHRRKAEQNAAPAAKAAARRRAKK